METKICTHCNKDLPTSEYYVIRKTGYVYPYCRKCHYSRYTKRTAKIWRKENPKRWLEDVHKAQRAFFGRQREGVYLLITSKGLYIGSTDKYNHRINQHINNDFGGNMKHKGAKVLFHFLLEEIYDRKTRLKREKHWIGKLKPALNKAHNPDYQKIPNGTYIKK